MPNAFVDRLLYRLVVFCAAMAVGSMSGVPWVAVACWVFFMLGSMISLAWVRE